METLEAITKIINQLSGKYETLDSDRKQTLSNIEKLTNESEVIEESLNIVIALGGELQKQISTKLSYIAEHAWKAIFTDPYSIKIDFQASGRGSLEANILFGRKNGNYFKPVLPSGQFVAGGGPIEMAAFGLRPALWARMKPRTRPIFMLDEPFRFLEKALIPKALQVLEKTSEKLGAQFIIVSHEPEYVAIADNIIEVTGGKGAVDGCQTKKVFKKALLKECIQKRDDAQKLANNCLNNPTERLVNVVMTARAHAFQEIIDVLSIKSARSKWVSLAKNNKRKD